MFAVLSSRSSLFIASNVKTSVSFCFLFSFSPSMSMVTQNHRIFSLLLLVFILLLLFPTCHHIQSTDYEQPCINVCCYVYVYVSVCVVCIAIISIEMNTRIRWEIRSILIFPAVFHITLKKNNTTTTITTKITEHSREKMKRKNPKKDKVWGYTEKDLFTWCKNNNENAANITKCLGIWQFSGLFILIFCCF